MVLRSIASVTYSFESRYQSAKGTPSPLPDLSKLFQTFGAAVFGIDADLAEADELPKHLREAMQYRTPDRTYGA